jgi:hypothetical protein
MSELVPEVHVNKNGVPVVKHVRPGGKKKKPTRPYYPPLDPAESRVIAQRRDLKQLIEIARHDIYFDGTNNDLPPTLIEYFKENFSDATIAAYLELAEQHKERSLNALMGVLANRDHDRIAGYVVRIVAQDTLDDNRWSNEHRGPYSYGEAMKIYYGLETYKTEGFSPARNILDDEDPATATTMSLIKYTNRMAEAGFEDEVGVIEIKGGRRTMHVIPSGDMVKLLVDRPHDADAIADIVLKDKIEDVGIIRDMLEAPTQSLRDGIL